MSDSEAQEVIVDIVGDVVVEVVAEAVHLSFEHGVEQSSKEATKKSDPRKQARVDDAKENDVVASTPPHSQNWDDFVNIEASIAIDGR